MNQSNTGCVTEFNVPVNVPVTVPNNPPLPEEDDDEDPLFCGLAVEAGALGVDAAPLDDGADEDADDEDADAAVEVAGVARALWAATGAGATATEDALGDC